MTGWRGPILVTGTDTGVGKTVVTAAIAAAAAPLSVAVVKPVQTGTSAFAAGEDPDALAVARLAGPLTAVTLASYPDPLAPLAAARISHQRMLPMDEVVEAISGLAKEHDVVLVEGAGGLLVPMGEQGWTVADLAVAADLRVVVVARAGLGTLNHTALTLEALQRRDIDAGVVIGAWPAVPELVHHANLHDLGPLLGCVPDGAGRLAPQDFRAAARTWLRAELHGSWFMPSTG